MLMKRKLASRACMFACRNNAPSHPRRRHSIRSVSCSPSSLSIYVHWPFCSRICPYCDFNRYLAADVDEERMLRCFRSELDHFYFHFGDSAVKDRTVTSVFFGGGTPSLASPKIFAGIMEHINKRWNVAADVEVTMEANPTSAEAKKLKDFKQSGVNRVSIGVQSLREDDLAFLGRAHSVQEAKRVIEGALGLFDRVSFDLIYARHGKQTPELWRQELQEAVKLGTSHLSLYTLTLEPGTEFYRRALHPSISDSRKPKVEWVENDFAADLYEVTQQVTSTAGFKQYEVSNFAMEGQQCRHNLAYWHSEDWIGAGPGASGRLTDGNNVRHAWKQVKHYNKWMESVEGKGHGIDEHETLTAEERITEVLLNGLRLCQGISQQRFKQHSNGLSFDQVRFFFGFLLLLHTVLNNYHKGFWRRQNTNTYHRRFS
ncbi:Radical S-adenosyl methionine domain-containing protein [Balamuthia mandrillaris]